MTHLLPGESLTPEPGERVTYRHTPPGGYGFFRDLPATVVRLTATGRVTIDVSGTRRTVSLMSISRTRPTPGEGSPR